MKSREWMREKGWKDSRKRDRTPLAGQVQRWVTHAYTPEEWQAAFKEHLTWKERFELLAKVNPQPREIKGESSVRIVFDMGGMIPKQVEGKVIDTPALPGGDEDDD